MLRKGLKTIEVNESVEFELSYYNANKFKKSQFSGFLNENKDEYWYQGGPKEACKYKVEVLRKGPKASPQQTLDSC